MPDRPQPSLVTRALLWAVGIIALVLGIIGIFLPGLPTTPFVLLAAACFVRVSPRAYTWLRNHRLFGPMLRDWETHRSIPLRAKGIALLMMTLSVSASLWYFSNRPKLQIIIFLAAAIGAIVIFRIPTRR
ncbi:MAG: YbaN family protein [Spongiibacteraceae bacterium]